MQKRWDILGIGSIAVDDLLYFDHYPQPNEKIPIQTQQRQGGGLTATALVAAARHGAQTAYCGRMGDDDLASFSLQALAREGVDTSPCQLVPGSAVSHSIILVDRSSGSRTIIQNHLGVFGPDPEIITEAMISGCRVLFIDPYAYEAALAAMKIAQAQRIPVVADIESVSLPDIDGFLKQIDHLIINIDVASALTQLTQIEAMVLALSGPRRAACVVTGGGQGCWYSEFGGPVQYLPAFAVDVVDTTGCGDVFHGAYAAALARGESVGQALRVATATAGIKASHPGGRQGIPDLATVLHFLQENSEQTE